MATIHPVQAEEKPLNVENSERQPQAPTAPIGEKSPIEEMKEKIKKPTIGLSLVIFLVLNAIMFIVGVTTVNECPIRPIIPIYLIVAGALGIVTKVVPILNRNRRLGWVDGILTVLVLVEFIWMILGSYWIYSIYQPSYHPEDRSRYCDKTAYLLAFWLLTINYICAALLILVPCCFMCLWCIIFARTAS